MSILRNENSSRTTDINGWIEIKGNPITKVGIFPYLGSQIDEQLEPNKIYKVYRPEEELNNPETIESFKLLPWVDDHEMLGENFTPAEQKGVAGVVGEDVYFEFPYLKANLKIFAEKFKNKILNGKKELSIGYHCLYDLTPGTWNGERYDVIQHTLRGNHLAGVDEGRSGPDVAVLDGFKHTLDEAIKAMEKTEEKTVVKDEGVTLESLSQQVQALTEIVTKLVEAEKEEVEIEETDNKDPVIDEKGAEVKEVVKDETVKAMDAQIKALTNKLTTLEKGSIKVLLSEVSKRNDLANKLSPLIGTFDHADKTLKEVAEYGVKELKLSCEKGEELAVLKGYLAGHKTNETRVSLDHYTIKKSSAIDKYLGGE